VNRIDKTSELLREVRGGISKAILAGTAATVGVVGEASTGKASPLRSGGGHKGKGDHDRRDHDKDRHDRHDRDHSDNHAHRDGRHHAHHDGASSRDADHADDNKDAVKAPSDSSVKVDDAAGGDNVQVHPGWDTPEAPLPGGPKLPGAREWRDFGFVS